MRGGQHYNSVVTNIITNMITNNYENQQFFTKLSKKIRKVTFFGSQCKNTLLNNDLFGAK